MAQDEQRRSERPNFQPHRATRLARVIVSAHHSDSDVRTVVQVCRASNTGLAPGTFRSWCHAEGIRASRVVNLIRVLRALRLVAEEGCAVSETLDADERTIRNLLIRGGVADILASVPVSQEEFCRRQQYVDNRFVVREIVRLLTTS